METYKVGDRNLGDGSAHQARSGKTGEAIVGQAHGKYYEAVSRGRCYGAQTAATGVAPGTSFSTTAAFALENPKGSGKRLVIQKVSLTVLSGTFTAGFVAILAQSDPTQASASGTAITPKNLKVGAANDSVAKPYTTATLGVTPSAIDLLCTLPKMTVDTDTAMQPTLIEKDLDGSITVEPGCQIAVHGTTSGAGTSPRVVINAQWEEVPLIQA